MNKALVVIEVFLMGGVLGCGYHFISGESEVLAGITTIAIPYFANKSYEPGLERYLTEALVDEFVKSRVVSVMDEGEAGAVLRGVIEEFREAVISYDKDDRALEYRVAVSLEVTLEKHDTGEVLWRNRELFHFEDYRVSQDIAITEANKEQALKKIAAELAERIHDSIIEGF